MEVVASLGRKVAKNQGAISAPKTKRIGKRYLHLGRPRYVGHVVKVTLRVWRLIIDSWGDDTSDNG